MNILGVILRASYRLRHHLWLGWSLARWVAILLVGLAVAALVNWWPSPWPASLLALLFLGYLLVLVWATRQGYLCFEALPEGAAVLQNPTVARPLDKEEKVPVRASGWFTVQEKGHYYVDLEADFETVGTREHIVLARVHPSRFLLVGRWPSEDWGWWYIFFEPHMIRTMTIGHLCHGPNPELAIRITYELNPETQQTAYLGSDSTSALQRIWEDLLLDAPLEVRDRLRGDSA